MQRLRFVVANARLPYLQPGIVSYLFLAILIAILHCGCKRLPLWVGLLCALWVNMDGWFILGPIVVAFWLVGSLIRRDSDAVSIKTLAIALVAALVGGLINPHLVFAYTLPDDLSLTLFDPEVAKDSNFRSYFDTGFANPKLSPAAAYSFYFLLVAGVASFAVNATTASMPRLLIWVAFALLAIWRWRFLPYFAVAGTPMVVLNIQDALTRREFGQQGRLIAVALRGLAVGARACAICCLARLVGAARAR